MTQQVPFLSNEQLLEVFSLTKTATAIHITEDAIIQTANDAMLQVWDKDTSVIGKSLADALPELKGQPFIDMFKRVWNEGLTISGRDTPADLNIDGKITTVYFDFEYRAIKDKDGKTICILHTATDVTDRFMGREALLRMKEKEEALEREQALNEELATSNEEIAAVNEEYLQIQESLSQLNEELEKRISLRTQDLTEVLERELALNETQLRLNDELSTINEEMTASNEELVATNEELALVQERLNRKIYLLAESESRFRSLVEQSPVAIALFKSTDLIIDIVNEQMLQIWSKTADIQGKPLAIAMPELIGQPFIPILTDIFTTGETFFAYESKATILRDGEPTEGYFNFICQPVKDNSGEITSVLQVVTDVTTQVKARLEVQKAEEMMRFAIDAAKLGVWHINTETNALIYNTTLADIFGYEGEENMTYDQAIAQVTEDYRDVINDEIQKAISGKGDYDITYSQRRFNDGELIWLRSLGKVTKDQNGDFSTFSGFVMDVTESKKDEERKNDFIGMVSHELKTPLTSLNGYLQLLQSKARKSNDTFTSGALEIAGKQVKKMTSMINGFLNISRLESGKIILNKSSFRLDELLKSTVEEVVVMDSDHNISFTIIDAIDIFADYDKISNVISNLLSNAVKYAPNSKEIEVTCQIVDHAAQISVRDEGMGINQEDIEKLFERYYRVENNHTISGFGIGLYLSAEIIERHNGKIWAESELGKGSTFYFSVPLA